MRETDKGNVIVLATGNKGKAREIRGLLAGRGLEIKDLNDFDPIPEPVEDGNTFRQNAYKKASATARLLGVPALADDSGLECAALGNAPGVLSARFGGPGLSDFERCLKLLEAMRGKADRAAAFVCVICIAKPGGAALYFEGRCEGRITEAPAGENGFGYDPVFFHPQSGKTFGELSVEEKIRVSHRGLALRGLSEEWESVKTWLKNNAA